MAQPGARPWHNPYSPWRPGKGSLHIRQL